MNFDELDKLAFKYMGKKKSHMPIEQMQKPLSHEKIETTLRYINNLNWSEIWVFKY